MYQSLLTTVSTIFRALEIDMQKLQELFSTAFGTTVGLGYILGPFFGLYAAIEHGSFLNAILSLFIPFYGVIYFFLA
jgi:hypothetical protein